MAIKDVPCSPDFIKIRPISVEGSDIFLQSFSRYRLLRFRASMPLPEKFHDYNGSATRFLNRAPTSFPALARKFGKSQPPTPQAMP